MKKKDPYLEELEKIDEGEEESAEEATKVDIEVPPPEEEIDVGEAPASKKEILSLAPDMPVQVVVVMGRKGVTVKDLLGLRMGQVVELDKVPGEAVDLVAAGKVIGKGELVEVDGKLGVRVLKLYK
jgi:flagellar motor switch protein FliM